MSSIPEARDQCKSQLYSVDASDPSSQLIDRSAMDPEHVEQINRIMASLGRLREAEETLSEASLKYMKLNQSDMRTLHFLIVAAHTEQIVTPGAIATQLGITTAATTKLLDRLEQAGHITRAPHPSDRRALAIEITPETHKVAMQTVGRQQSKRFYAAARLTPDEREAVIRFIDDMTSEIAVSTDSWPAHQNN